MNADPAAAAGPADPPSGPEGPASSSGEAGAGCSGDGEQAIAPADHPVEADLPDGYEPV